MIYFDVTKTAAASHRSGLVRVSERLREELGDAVVPVTWSFWRKRFVAQDGRKIEVRSDDWWFTPEIFRADERRGFAQFLSSRPCRLAGLFPDAIPVRLPEISWPQAVRRHAPYMAMLAEFDRVLAISNDSRRELLGFWGERIVTPRAEVSCVELGADFDRTARGGVPLAPSARAALLCVGIIEPRKNQAFLLEVCRALWGSGLDFDLHVVGRVNPHHGKRIAAELREFARTEPRLRVDERVSDAALGELYRTASAVVFPTIAEGCGLPLLEALWRGTPCVCSDLPVLRENAEGGGVIMARLNDAADWQAALTRLLAEPDFAASLRAQAATRALPTWSDTARQVRSALAE